MPLGAQSTSQLPIIVLLPLYVVAVFPVSVKTGLPTVNGFAGSAAQGVISTLTGMGGCGAKLPLVSRGPSKEGLASRRLGKVELIRQGVETDSNPEGFHNRLRGKAMGA